MRSHAEIREADKIRYEARRQIAHSHLGDRCRRCGGVDDLEFDHVDPASKSFELTHGYCRPLADFLAEVAKCQVLCRPCHSEKSIRERGNTVTKNQDVHGSLTAYRYCRCDMCRSAKAVANRAYKARLGFRERRSPEHGEYGMYRKGCRCEPCRTANASRNRAYRESAITPS